MITIAQEWESYRDRVLPRDADETQIDQCERAFYAGNLSFFTIITRQLSHGNDVSKADIGMLTALKKELRDFAMKAGATR